MIRSKKRVLLLTTLASHLDPIDAELTFICNIDPAFPNDIYAMPDYEYMYCGDQCTCSSVETLCFSQTVNQNSRDKRNRNDETSSEYNFHLASYNYSRTCRDCYCNVFTDDLSW